MRHGPPTNTSPVHPLWNANGADPGIVKKGICYCKICGHSYRVANFFLPSPSPPPPPPPLPRFLYRRSSAIMSCTSTHGLFWIIGPPFSLFFWGVGGGGGDVTPSSIFVGDAYSFTFTNFKSKEIKLESGVALKPLNHYQQFEVWHRVNP